MTPSLELGVRHDGGDAETGTGLELGDGLAVFGGGFAGMPHVGLGLVGHGSPRRAPGASNSISARREGDTPEHWAGFSICASW